MIDPSTLPPAPSGAKFPHQGQFTDAQLEAVRAKGYEPVDVRVHTDDSDLLIHGMLLGSLRFTEDQLKALEWVRRAEGKSGLKRDKRPNQLVTGDVLDTLKAIPRSKAFASRGTAPGPAAEKIGQEIGQKRKGRPKGSKDSKPRVRAVAEEAPAVVNSESPEEVEK